MFTLDNVDWTQIPPDNNTGIQFPVQLHTSGPLALSDAHVVQHNAADLSSSALTVKADVTNHAHHRAERRVSPRPSPRPPAPGSHSPPLGDGGPGATQTVSFTPATPVAADRPPGSCGGRTGWARSRSTACA